MFMLNSNKSYFIFFLSIYFQRASFFVFLLQLHHIRDRERIEEQEQKNEIINKDREERKKDGVICHCVWCSLLKICIKQ